LIADYVMVRPGKGGGRERVAGVLAKISAAFGPLHID
jgi:hypothetical protein